MDKGRKALFTPAECARIAGGRVVADAGSPVEPFFDVVVDSRKSGPGSLFVALPGERVDGSDFVIAAMAAGARVCLLSEEGLAGKREAILAAALAAKAALIAVPKALPALQSLAGAWRSRFPSIYRIGVTGSSGKTTTKELIASVLPKGRTVVNEGNLNSDVGLSLSMFAIEGSEAYGVFEMGMNRAGEMAELAAVLEPDLVAVTNIGVAHIGILGSREAIAFEKRQAFSRFDGRQAVLLREDEPFRAFMAEGLRGRLLSYGARSTRGFEGARDLGLDGWAIDYRGRRIGFPLVGPHNLADALCALSVSDFLELDPDLAAEGLASVRPLFGRSEIERGRVTIVKDCYNANPDSMEAAMGFCDSLDWKGRRCYALGSMLELGAESAAAHRALGRAAASSRADALFFFGAEAEASAEEARSAGFRGPVESGTDIDALGAALASWIGEGDLLLLKASRGMALERLADFARG